LEEEMIGAIDPETSPNGGITIYDQNINERTLGGRGEYTF